MSKMNAPTVEESTYTLLMYEIEAVQALDEDGAFLNGFATLHEGSKPIADVKVGWWLLASLSAARDSDERRRIEDNGFVVAPYDSGCIDVTPTGAEDGDDPIETAKVVADLLRSDVDLIDMAIDRFSDAIGARLLKRIQHAGLAELLRLYNA